MTLSRISKKRLSSLKMRTASQNKCEKNFLSTILKRVDIFLIFARAYTKLTLITIGLGLLVIPSSITIAILISLTDNIIFVTLMNKKNNSKNVLTEYKKLLILLIGYKEKILKVIISLEKV